MNARARGRSRRSRTSSSPPAIRRRSGRRAAATSSPPAASSNRRASGRAARCRRRFRRLEALPRGPLASALMWLVGVPLIAYLLVLAYLYVFQRQLLYFPDRSRPELGLLAQLGAREVSLTTADGLSLLS